MSVSYAIKHDELVMLRTNGDEWHDLSGVWAQAAAHAVERDKNLTSTRPLIEDYELLGVLGEFVAGLELGLEPDLGVYLGGDRGADFGGLDVKGTAGGRRRLRDPHLIVDAWKLDAGARWFALVILEPELERGRVAGWATPDELREHPNDMGNGPVYAMRSSELHPGLPLGVLE
jgi:hypothetical protein